MDRNTFPENPMIRINEMSLSARRAWIEILTPARISSRLEVALRKESVDRNSCYLDNIEIIEVALRKESVDRNLVAPLLATGGSCRSPQGERG